MARTADAAPTTGCASCHAEVPADAGFCPQCGASRAPGRAPAPVLPGYTILRMLGQGGAAVVYLARQEALERDVAVKVLRRHVDDPKAWRDFRREARTIARLSGHPNVVTVYTAGRSEAGQPYLVTEYLDRGSLADVIAAEGPGPPHVVAKVGVAVADALEAAHALGILHRDVKPGNVLLDHDGRVKLGDFGIARLLAGQGITTTDTVAFTPEHVAPEILRSEREGPWSDLYGLASTLAAALVGESIFRQQPGERMEALLTRKLMSPPPPLPASVPASLAEPIAHALDPDPARRPSLGELRAQLAEAAESLAGNDAPPAATTVRAAVPIAVPIAVPAVGDVEDHPAAGERDRDVAPVAGPPLLGELHRSRRGWLAIPAVLLAIIVAVLGARLLADDGGEDTAADTTTATAPAASTAPAGTSPVTAAPTTMAAAIAPATSVASAPPATTVAAPAAVPAPVVTAPPATAAPRPAVTAPAATSPPPAGPADAGPDLVDQPTAENFVRDYYDAVAAGDYETSWAQLAPEFQRGKAVSYEYYTDFWDDNDIAVADVRLVDATATEAFVNVQLFWNDSSTSVTDQFTLRRGDAGELLIAAQRSIGG